MRLRIRLMKRVARMIRSHRELIGSWFRARKALSSGGGVVKQQSEIDYEKSVRL